MYCDTNEMMFIIMCVIFSHILMWGVKTLVRAVKTLAIRIGAKTLRAELKTIELMKLRETAEKLVDEK